MNSNKFPDYSFPRQFQKLFNLFLNQLLLQVLFWDFWIVHAGKREVPDWRVSARLGAGRGNVQIGSVAEAVVDDNLEDMIKHTVIKLIR